MYLHPRLLALAKDVWWRILFAALMNMMETITMRSTTVMATSRLARCQACRTWIHITTIN